MKKIEIDETVLRQLVDGDTQNRVIADYFGCSESCIERRMKKLGLSKARTGPKNAERHPKWKGGRTMCKGYVYLYAPDHPHAVKGRYVAEHRLVMEEILGRYLDPKEVVHHKDENRANNDPSNLSIYPSNGEHLEEHLSENPDHVQRVKEGMRKAALLGQKFGRPAKDDL